MKYRTSALLLLALFLFSACAGQVTYGRKTKGKRPARTSQAFATGGHCRAVTAHDRRRLLALAQPRNFPRTRYRLGSDRPIEKETDCSRFVHEIYRRAGLPFGFRTTRDLASAPEFELLPESRARPGDLMLFRGHVGIVNSDGRIISATKNRRGRSSITSLDRDAFRRSRNAKVVLRYRCAQPRQLAQDFSP